MIIFTIGIGTAEGELLRIRDERGRMDYIRDEQGNPVKSHLNEELLQQIAQATKKAFIFPCAAPKPWTTLRPGDRAAAQIRKIGPDVSELSRTISLAAGHRDGAVAPGNVSARPQAQAVETIRRRPAQPQATWRKPPRFCFCWRAGRGAGAVRPAPCANITRGNIRTRSRITTSCSKRKRTIPGCISMPARRPIKAGNWRRRPSNSTTRWHRPICSCNSAPITTWATPVPARPADA